MAAAISELVSAAGWKLRTLLRTRRFYTDAALVILYKAHLLNFLEYGTPAIYHATRTVLRRLDALQSGFLKDIGINEVTALVNVRLAPLSTRRDIAMLGLIHRTTMGKGPQQFQFFFRKTSDGRSLIDPRRESASPMIKRSALGLVAVYNMLPPRLLAEKSVSAFQKRLQEYVIMFAASGYPRWPEVLSPRLPLVTHPLATYLHTLVAQ